jgi:uncharacterized membrane protein YhaH (DUF805 family)
MTFQEAVKTCFTKYADFNGRASKEEFWWFFLFLFAVAVVLHFVSDMLGSLFSLATLVPALAVGARRLHDTDKSGWLQLIGLIPVLGFIGLVYLWVQPAKDPNRFSGTTEAAPSV